MKGNMRSLRNLFPPACKAPTIRAMDMDDAIAASKRSYCMAVLRDNHRETWQDSDMKPRCHAASSVAVSKRPSVGYHMTGLRGTHSETRLDMADVKLMYDAAVSKGSSFESEELSDSHSEMTSSGNVMPRCDQAQVPEKMCPCGAGVCKVWTAATEKNAGRQFYKCPLKKEEGHCGFFQWCDGNTRTSQGLSKADGDSHNHLELLCPCGAGVCIKLTAKTEKNMGRQFYKCPLGQGKGCTFFRWCDEAMLPSKATTEPCYNCGMDDHLAKDCPLDDQVRMPTGQETCFKCGQVGHWAKNCQSRQSSHGSKGAAGGFNSYGGETRGFLNASCCGSPKTNREMGAAVKSPVSGFCFKCGSQGHWAKDCPTSSSEGQSQGFSFGKSGASGRFF